MDMKLSFGNQKYIPYFLRIITIMENQYVFFQIKVFYLKKLHFNCTFSLDPVSIIYNYKQGFEEMIWISIEILKFQNFFLYMTTKFYWKFQKCPKMHILDHG